MQHEASASARHRTSFLIALVAVLTMTWTSPVEAQDPSPAQDQYAGSGCIFIAELEGGPWSLKQTQDFDIGSTILRVVYDIASNNDTFRDHVFIRVYNADTFRLIERVKVFEGEAGVLEIPTQPGRYFVEGDAWGASFRFVVEAEGGNEPCTLTNSANGNDNPNGGGNGGDGIPDDVIKESIPDNKVLVDTGGPGVPLLGGSLVAMGLLSLGIALLRRT